MNHKMIWYTVGQVLEVLAALLVLPLVVSLLYHESCWSAFLVTLLLSLAAGFTLTMVYRKSSHVIYAKEGFVIVALSWVLLSLIGALPFVISGEIPHYADAFFEVVSGFTTTGASILTDVESMSHGLLFWRSFTHWVGGMGVLVFMMAIVPAQNDRSMHVMRAEVPGPTVGKLVPRLHDSARILYLIYIGMSVLELVFLLAGGMPVFDSFCLMFGTAGTGGFAVRADSVASYSPYLQWVITIFMILFGVNFNLYYYLLRGQAKSALRSQELHVYLGIWIVTSLFVMGNLISIQTSGADAVRLSFFQTASIMTTTGYSTADFNTWPELSKTVLVLLMFIGACAGSTGGGLKVSRIIMLFADVKRELRHLLHPRSVGVVKFEGKRVSDDQLSSVTSYFLLYVLTATLIVLLLSLDRFDLETNFTAMAACLNNIGPGLGQVGPMSSYAEYSTFSKIVLSIAMLLGRLEIYPVLITLTPSTWITASRTGRRWARRGRFRQA